MCPLLCASLQACPNVLLFLYSDDPQALSVAKDVEVIADLLLPVEASRRKLEGIWGGLCHSVRVMKGYREVVLAKARELGEFLEPWTLSDDTRPMYKKVRFKLKAALVNVFCDTNKADPAYSKSHAEEEVRDLMTKVDNVLGEKARRRSECSGIGHTACRESCERSCYCAAEAAAAIALASQAAVIEDGPSTGKRHRARVAPVASPAASVEAHSSSQPGSHRGRRKKRVQAAAPPPGAAAAPSPEDAREDNASTPAVPGRALEQGASASGAGSESSPENGAGCIGAPPLTASTPAASRSRASRASSPGTGATSQKASAEDSPRDEDVHDTGDSGGMGTATGIEEEEEEVGCAA